MSDNDRARASISATLDELVTGHHALELPVEEGEFCEAYGIIMRIEATMLHRGQGVLD